MQPRVLPTDVDAIGLQRPFLRGRGRCGFVGHFRPPRTTTLSEQRKKLGLDWAAVQPNRNGFVSPSGDISDRRIREYLSYSGGEDHHAGRTARSRTYLA